MIPVAISRQNSRCTARAGSIRLPRALPPKEEAVMRTANAPVSLPELATPLTGESPPNAEA